MRASESIARLYRSHGPVVLRRARRLLGNDADAHEVLQEVFTRLLQEQRLLDDMRSPSAFLTQMTIHRCLNRIRDTRRRGDLVALHGGQLAPAGASDPEARTQLRDLLARLPVNEGEAVVYYYLEEMSQAEIAERMGCSQRWIGKILERANGHIRDMEVTRC